MHFETFLPRNIEGIYSWMVSIEKQIMALLV